MGNYRLVKSVYFCCGFTSAAGTRCQAAKEFIFICLLKFQILARGPASFEWRYLFKQLLKKKIKKSNPLG